MKARIRVTLKNGVLDPQGKAIENALGGLGIPGVAEVRQGKYFEVDLKEPTKPKPKRPSRRCAKTCSPTL